MQQSCQRDPYSEDIAAVVTCSLPNAQKEVLNNKNKLSIQMVYSFSSLINLGNLVMLR